MDRCIFNRLLQLITSDGTEKRLFVFGFPSPELAKTEARLLLRAGGSDQVSLLSGSPLSSSSLASDSVK